MGSLTKHLLQLYVFHAVWISCVISQAFTRLGRMNVNPDFISVSGFSSGGTMAQTMFVSWSSLFSGVATFSHTYYRCGPGNGLVQDYDDVCTTMGNRRPNELYNPRNAVADIQNYFANGIIDNPANMANKPLYVFAGTSNFLFTTDMTLRVLQVLGPFINNPQAIRTRVMDANLTLPTNRQGLPLCNEPPAEFFAGNCGFSGAFEALQFLLGSEAVRMPSYGNVKLQQLLTFDQSEFFFGIEGPHTMDTMGFLYIPKMCKVSGVQCLLHIFFHGCLAGRQFLGSSHILNSGYLEVAETNGIIMLFPQVLSSSANMIGCWDTYGYNGPLYATKRGGQVGVVKNMIDRILGGEIQVQTQVSPAGQAQTLHAIGESMPITAPEHTGVQVQEPVRIGSNRITIPYAQSTSFRTNQFRVGSIQGGQGSPGTNCMVSSVSPRTVLQRCY